MKSIGISEFKAKCISILKEVRAQNEVLTVTVRGKPLVRIEPIPQEERVLGGLAAHRRIKADLVPFDFAEDWEMDA